MHPHHSESEKTHDERGDKYGKTRTKLKKQHRPDEVLPHDKVNCQVTDYPNVKRCDNQEEHSGREAIVYHGQKSQEEASTSR